MKTIPRIGTCRGNGDWSAAVKPRRPPYTTGIQRLRGPWAQAAGSGVNAAHAPVVGPRRNSGVTSI
jgi:hypothetical protein